MKAAYTISADASERKARNAQFHKRKDTLFWKGNEMHEKLGAEVYFVIKYQGQWYEYSSNPDLSFPLSRKDIVRASSCLLLFPPTKQPLSISTIHQSRLQHPILSFLLALRALLSNRILR